MKKNYPNFLLLVPFIFFLFIMGCEEEEDPIRNEPPKIAFSVREADLIGVNMDMTTKPKITGTVQADAGLREVTIELLRGDQAEVLENVTTFDEVNRIIYVIDLAPAYAEDLTGFRVSAVDEQDRTVEKALTIETYSSPVFEPMEGLAGTEVTVTSEELSGTEVQSVMIGEVEVEEFSVDGNSLTFTVPEGALPGAITINRANTYSLVTAGSFTVLTETPKVLNTYPDVVVNAQGDRNDEGVATAFSAEGNVFTLAEGLEEENSEQIDFITADSGGDDKLDLFSPGHSSWLPNNYFKKDAEGDMTWPVLNNTRLQHLEDKGLDFFTNITMEELKALEMTEEKSRIELGSDGVGAVILFITADAKKGLLYFKAHDSNAGAGSKADIFTFDIKVLEEI